MAQTRRQKTRKTSPTGEKDKMTSNTDDDTENSIKNMEDTKNSTMNKVVETEGNEHGTTADEVLAKDTETLNSWHKEQGIEHTEHQITTPMKGISEQQQEFTSVQGSKPKAASKSIPVTPIQNSFAALSSDEQQAILPDLHLWFQWEGGKGASMAALPSISSHIGQVPWCVAGDFNAVMNKQDRLGAAVRWSEMQPMTVCMHGCGLEDMKASGRFYTWSNKQEGTNRVFSKIDRPCAMENVQQAWDTEVRGCQMFQVAITKAKAHLEETQKLLHQDPHNKTLIDQECQANRQFREANSQYLSWLHQKAKLHWLQMGDSNSKIFYNSLKARSSRNTINRLMDGRGNWIEEWMNLTYWRGAQNSTDSRSGTPRGDIDRATQAVT
ncbi:Glycogen phosphorylase [Bienertia sinuspersici]